MHQIVPSKTDEAKGGPNWELFKVQSYLVHPLVHVVPSIRFHTLVCIAHDTPLFCSVALALPHFPLSLWHSLASLSRFGTPSLCSAAFALPHFTQSLFTLLHFAQSIWRSLASLSHFSRSLASLSHFSCSLASLSRF